MLPIVPHFGCVFVEIVEPSLTLGVPKAINKTLTGFMLPGSAPSGEL